jgi:hypothetical protein
LSGPANCNTYVRIYVGLLSVCYSYRDDLYRNYDGVTKSFELG